MKIKAVRMSDLQNAKQVVVFDRTFSIIFKLETLFVDNSLSVFFCNHFVSNKLRQHFFRGDFLLWSGFFVGGKVFSFNILFLNYCECAFFCVMKRIPHDGFLFIPKKFVPVNILI